MKALLTWFKALFAASASGPQATLPNFSSPSKPSSTNAPSTPAKPRIAKLVDLAERELGKKETRNKVQPQLAKLGRELLRRLAAEGLTFKVTSGNRTQAEQDALYAQGRTKPGKVVTWTRRSRHIGGRAIDLTLFSGKNPDWESKHYDRAGVIGEELGLVWGGRCKRGTTDRPHFELPSA